MPNSFKSPHEPNNKEDDLNLMTTQMPPCEWRLSSWLLHQPLRIFAATNKQKGDKAMLLVIIAKCFRATLATAMTPAISMETAVQDNRFTK